MAKIAFLVGSLLFFVVLVAAERKETPFTYKAAAEICRSYFDACRASSGGDTAKVAQCFQKLRAGCLIQMKSTLDEIKRCVRAAGLDVDQVKKCISITTEV